ncbi:unnamed protein product, partial [Penicillium discolor]
FFDHGGDLGAGLLAGQGRVEVDAFAAARHGQGVEAHAGEERPGDPGDLGALRQVGAGSGVQVEHETVGATGQTLRGEPPLRHVQLDRRDLREPDQCGHVLHQRIRLGAVGVLDVLPRDPVRSPGLELLREERVFGSRGGADALDPALAGDRAAVEEREEQGCDGGVVGDDLALGRARLRIDDLVEVGHAQSSAVDLYDLRLSHHGASVVKGWS